MGMVQTVQMAVQMKLKTSRVTSFMPCGLLDKPWSCLNDDRFFFRKRRDKFVVALWCWPSVACWVKFSWEENVSYMYMWETNLFSMNFLGSLKYFFLHYWNPLFILCSFVMHDWLCAQYNKLYFLDVGLVLGIAIISKTLSLIKLVIILVVGICLFVDKQ